MLQKSSSRSLLYELADSTSLRLGAACSVPFTPTLLADGPSPPKSQKTFRPRLNTFRPTLTGLSPLARHNLKYNLIFGFWCGVLVLVLLPYALVAI